MCTEYGYIDGKAAILDHIRACVTGLYRQQFRATGRHGIQHRSTVAFRSRQQSDSITLNLELPVEQVHWSAPDTERHKVILQVIVDRLPACHRHHLLLPPVPNRQQSPVGPWRHQLIFTSWDTPYGKVGSFNKDDSSGREIFLLRPTFIAQRASQCPRAQLKRCLHAGNRPRRDGDRSDRQVGCSGDSGP